MAATPEQLGFHPVVVTGVAIERLLARGGHSQVLAGTAKLGTANTEVVVKVWNHRRAVQAIAPAAANKTGEAADKETFDSFSAAQREFNILRHLSNRTDLCVEGRIPTAIDLTTTADGVHSVLIESPVAQPVRASCTIGRGVGELVAPAVDGRQLCELVWTLQQIHDAGVAHRDLKPSNVMIHDDRLLLVDFDVACHFDELVEGEWMGKCHKRCC
jgi:serine/threonine protein kinase